MYSPKIIVASSHHDVKADMIAEPSSDFCSTNHYYQQLKIESIRQYSLTDAIRLASQANMKHDANGCCCCDVVAGYYMTALKYARESEPIHCNGDLFDLVWRIANLVLAHRETSKYQYLSWFDLITEELWEFAKQLKEESFECDLHIPTQGISKRGSVDSLASDASDSSGGESENDEENYRRAIRITIYNCRALVCEQSNEINQAIIYYRKCASVRPTPFDQQRHLQQTALAAMQRLIRSAPTSPTLNNRRPITHLAFMSTEYVCTSETVSSASSLTSLKTSMCCAQCGIEKSVMPVCAKCKVQPYCSVRCVKSHCSVRCVKSHCSVRCVKSHKSVHGLCCSSPVKSS